MFSRNRDDTHESGTTGRNRTDRSQRPRCVIAYRNREARQDFQRNLEPAEAGRGINISGVDFWHAVEFSRNGRFLCTHPLRLSSGLSLRSCVSDSIRLFRVRFPVEAGPLRSRRFVTALSSSSLSRFPFRRVRLYQILSGLIPSQRGLSSRLLGRSDE